VNTVMNLWVLAPRSYLLRPWVSTCDVHPIGVYADCLSGDIRDHNKFSSELVSVIHSVVVYTFRLLCFRGRHIYILFLLFPDNY
jgi:hypothetical protein